ncbi:MAG: DUF2156 domain-containing protein [Acetivibrio ethanolgignens]
MNYEEKKITPQSQYELSKYAKLRPIYISEGQFLNQFIWSNFYDTTYITGDSFLFYLIIVLGDRSSMLPYCKIEDIPSVFRTICDYFHNELKKPLTMYLADETFVEALRAAIPDIENTFSIEEDRDCFDYIYDAEKLRTLSGKAYHKKKNHVNAFLKDYAGRFEYKTLCCKNASEIEDFHKRWLTEREITGRRDSMSSEEIGINQIFEHCFEIDSRLGGVYIDGVLEAYSIGSYNPDTKYAYIHIEKANPECRGLYPFINQQFLVHEFPEALFVNREDDLGQEGLRNSKLSYKPVRLEKKFVIRENR